MSEKQEYTGKQIKVLEGLEGVRLRPAMYIGSTGKEGLHHLVYEAVDNSVDEALAGACKVIQVTLNKDGSATIEDDGRGIPVDIHPKFKIPAVEVALTKLHAGGKFDKKSYMISGGLHGVGISVVNALSKKLIIEVRREGKIYQQEYSKGEVKSKLTIVGKYSNGGTGTKVTFWPDEEIFSTLNFDYKFLENRLREIAFLNAELRIILTDDIKNKKEEFFYSGGLIEFVKLINKSKEVLHKPIYFKREINGSAIEVAIQYNSGYQENIFGFVNTINTVEGGTHVSGFKTALTRVINDYAKKKGLLKNEALSGEDVREGLTVIISLKIPNPQFEGQTKTKLGNSEIKGQVDSVVTSALAEFFEENPTIARKITAKSMDAAKARLAAKKAKDLVRRKSSFSLGGLPGKLSDCSNKKSDDTELYLVEGESAGGSSRQARNKETQAILPLKGKILNVEKSSPAKAFSSEEIANIITVIGTGVGEQFNLERLRYKRVIIMSVDGEESTFIQSPSGGISFVKIGSFIDSLIKMKINTLKYKILCFNLKTRKTQFKPIKAVIKHPIEEKLYEIKTSYGRSVRITSSHSIFVFEEGNIKLKRGNEVKKGDKIVAPKNLPLYNYSLLNKIDVLSLLIKNKKKITNNIYVRGKPIEFLIKEKIISDYSSNNEFVDSRVVISEELAGEIVKKRKEKNLSQKFWCKKLGIRQPCVYYNWEKRKSKPSLKNFEKYIEVLGINKNSAFSQIQIVKSKLESIWENQYKNSNRNKLKNYIKLSEMQKEDIKRINGEVTICPMHYKNLGINRFIDINENLMKLIGFWMAEGSCSLRNGVRLSIGDNDNYLVEEFSNAFKDIFGLNAKLSHYKTSPTCSELKIVNRAASLFWQSLFGFSAYSSITKKIPDIIFNVNKEMQLEFLRAYFLGDGTISKNGISFTTTSKEMANQIMYLLLSHGIIAGLNTRKPSLNNKIKSRNLVYTINITSKDDLVYLKRIWQNHRNSSHLDRKLNSKFPSINKKFEIISDDLIALNVTDINEVQSSNNQVYDFSVDEDENFIAGLGGLCCHNTDADVDGEHIKTLLLTFFFRFMPQLIENSNIYVALPPLYRIRKGKDYYVYSDEELKKTIEKLGGGDVTRFKGLGEMSSDQLWDTTMDPKKRKIKKIFIEDAVEADRVFTMLMGDDVQARKEFISENAKEAQLDV